jgi:hypothetical protein
MFSSSGGGNYGGSGGGVAPPYQIDFTAIAAGKRIANTKRRIRWYVVKAWYDASN